MGLVNTSVTGTFRKYVGLYMDTLGFAELSSKTTREAGGEHNIRFDGFFNRNEKYKRLIELYQKAGSRIQFLNLSDSMLFYQEVEDVKEELLPGIFSSMLGIGRQFQADLLRVNGILSRGAIGIGDASFGVIEGVFAGPLLAELVVSEKKVRLPVISVSPAIADLVMKRQVSVREQALVQMGACELEFAFLESGVSYPVYLDGNVDSDLFSRLQLKMVVMVATGFLKDENVSPAVKRSWIWVLDELLAKSSHQDLDGKGHSLIDFVNVQLRSDYQACRAGVLASLK